MLLWKQWRGLLVKSGNRVTELGSLPQYFAFCCHRFWWRFSKTSQLWESGIQTMGGLPTKARKHKTTFGVYCGDDFPSPQIIWFVKDALIFWEGMNDEHFSSAWNILSHWSNFSPKTGAKLRIIHTNHPFSISVRFEQKQLVTKKGTATTCSKRSRSLNDLWLEMVAMKILPMCVTPRCTWSALC